MKKIKQIFARFKIDINSARIPAEFDIIKLEEGYLVGRKYLATIDDVIALIKTKLEDRIN